MGRELPHTPGSQRVYSNVGFLVLGLIVEQVSGNDLIGYVRKNVLGPLDWVPVTELVQGRTFPAQRDPREPWYDCHKSAVNVFNPFYPPDPVYYYELPNYVIESDGGWDHEARIGQGGIVSSTSMMLHLAENYYIEEKGCSNNSYGLPTGGKRQDRFHTGAFCGTNAVLQQRKDGINFAVIFNKDGKDVKTTLTYYEAIRIRINDTIKNVNINWPTQGIDGQWADFTKATAGEGSFEDPWNDLSLAIKGIADEGTLNIKPGKKRWTGTIKKKMRIRAPLGTATIGKAP
jgi:hypothetical protein